MLCAVFNRVDVRMQEFYVQFTGIKGYYIYIAKVLHLIYCIRYGSFLGNVCLLAILFVFSLALYVART